MFYHPYVGNFNFRQLHFFTFLIRFSLVLLSFGGQFVAADCPQKATSQLIVVKAWTPPAPPVAPSRAGYFAVTNISEHDQRLLGASSEAFKQISIHRTIEENGVMSMEMVDELNIPHGTSQVFSPGGLHLMMMHPNRTLKRGDNFQVTLSFASGQDINVTMTVLSKNTDSSKTLSTAKKVDHHAH